MLLRISSVEYEIDKILDSCMDTGVGCPEDLDDYDLYYKENEMELKYIWFAIWLVDKHIYLDKKIEKYNKKYLNGFNSREASHQVLTNYFAKWKVRNIFE